jgi:hypothetical protein
VYAAKSLVAKMLVNPGIKEYLFSFIEKTKSISMYLKLLETEKSFHNKIHSWPDDLN